MLRRSLPLAALVLASGSLLAQPPAEVKPALTLKGHTDPVYAVSYSPDGKVIATGSFDKSIKLWDADNGKELRTLAGPTGHQSLVLSVAFSPDGKLLASGGADNAAKLWDATGAKPEPTSLPHPNLVDCVAFDKDGKRLATACHDGVVRIFDLSKPGPPPAPKEIKAHVAMPLPHPVYVVAWSPDGKLLASGSFDQTIKLWDAATGNPVREIKGFPAVPPEKDKPVPPGHRDQVFCLAFSKDGKLLASGSSDRTVKLWDVATGNLVRDFPNPTLKSSGPGQPVPSHAGFVHAVRFTADGQSLFSAGTAPRNQGSLAVWTVADGKLKAASEIAFGPIYAFDMTADGKSVLIGCGPRVRTASEAEAYVIPLPTK